jgi:hypothetical protein
MGYGKKNEEGVVRSYVFVQIPDYFFIYPPGICQGVILGIINKYEKIIPDLLVFSSCSGSAEVVDRISDKIFLPDIKPAVVIEQVGKSFS